MNDIALLFLFYLFKCGNKDNMEFGESLDQPRQKTVIQSVDEESLSRILLKYLYQLFIVYLLLSS